MTELNVSFIVETTALAPGDELSFGRAADLVIDADNLHLHRHLGTLFHQGELWWLANVGTQIVMTVVDPATGIHTACPPGSSAPLNAERVEIRFEAEQHSYQIDCEMSGLSVPQLQADPITNAAQTITWGQVDLNEEQRLLLASLAEAHLRDRDQTAALPSNKTVYTDLGWSRAKFDRKLDHLCSRLDRLGVRGLVGGQGDNASQRRHRLVEHVVAFRLIGDDDLALLDRHRQAQRVHN